jgi:hypothetical protein
MKRKPKVSELQKNYWVIIDQAARILFLGDEGNQEGYKNIIVFTSRDKARKYKKYHHIDGTAVKLEINYYNML